jgi:hypothetical protein
MLSTIPVEDAMNFIEPLELLRKEKKIDADINDMQMKHILLVLILKY